MGSDLLTFFDSERFLPHGYCLLWKSRVLYLHVVSDLVTAAAYFSIPLALLYFVRRRNDLEFRFMFHLFGAFIVACGTTHLLAAWTIWHPVYDVQGIVKSATAVISAVTAVMLWPMIPKALALPNPSALEAINRRLSHEIEERKAAEGQVRRLNSYLEEKVATRTQELQVVNESLRTEIEERRHAEADLRKLSRAVEQSPNLVMITDATGCIEYVNSKAVEMTGYAMDELLGQNPRILSSGESSLEVYHTLWERILSGQEWRGVFHNKKKDGKLYWVQEWIAPLRDPTGRITHFVAIQEDVTEARLLSEQLSYNATHDLLTGLYNRYEFERRCTETLLDAQTTHSEHALCYIDLDQFKVVNDSCSHIAGDELLRQISRLMQQGLRQTDVLARLGGDEFAILLGRCSLGNAERIANALRKRVEDFQFIYSGRSFRVGCSIGIVAVTEASHSVGQLLMQADSACYLAKDQGRNRVRVYRSDDQALKHREREILWVPEITMALEGNRCFLCQQSIKPLRSPADRGLRYEILLRMNFPWGETVPPGAFLAAAERYNIAWKIDRWVIRTYLNWLGNNRSHLDRLDLASINLSGQSISNPDLRRFICQQLKKNKVPAEKICFEITETAVITNLSAATAFIQHMKDYGCKFSLDDFGSGLSSYGYLKQLPVDFLKIDGLFVRDILHDPMDLAIVKSINEIGHILGKQTIAEFVENLEILEKLQAFGVDYAQGYGISQPERLF